MATMTVENFGTRIRFTRENLVPRLSRSKLAARFGKTHAWVGKNETGKTKECPPELEEWLIKNERAAKRRAEYRLKHRMVIASPELLEWLREEDRA